MFENAITITELQHKIKRGLESTLAPSYWVVAEVGQVNIASNGHCYLELVERGEQSQYTKAKISAAIWRYSGSALESRFRKVTGTPLSVGMKLLICVRVGYHELYGLSLVVIDIEPSFTLGEAERIRRQTIERLEKEGLMNLNKSIPLPRPLQRIAVISSERAAGYGDFCNELKGNSYGFDYNITLFNSVVQGAGAEGSIINSLLEIYQSSHLFHSIVVIRGGGSSDDLSCFNSWELCSVMAQSPLPIITGIGHDRDLSIADMVAAISLKTPTAVARYLIDSSLEVDGELEELYSFLHSLFIDEVELQKSQLERLSLLLKSHVGGAVEQNGLMLHKMEQQISRLSMSRSHEELVALSKMEEGIKTLFSRAIFSSMHSLDSKTQLLKGQTSKLIERTASELDYSLMQIQSFDPQRIVELGYAIAKTNGRLLRSGKDVNKGDLIDLELSDATLSARIENLIIKD